ncbi:MAG: threonylcarbamoyl-AMP synthase [Tateyamaria sp.]|jgi:L-threonylcarbamoyladenylate synthase|nr:threonylcarbamoyl-AMP synthase [Tateyamaria sp.]MBT5301236.1 threonylcarbamoyl-AMP synthase [Tateyamaria sp.]MBT6267472.1 threonylcarbamoyl-AMP synthase [Tateyamaria sp.]MBT6343678.1 threonylcarbamoyl-AMP synthase [Tateyamaria sp.]MBT7447686.1 threonylcarbamoyl-AMP synthase [Tateyamaria sp.]
MDQLHTEILASNDNDLITATNFLANGRLVAFPTETVYGLGADATNNVAVAHVFAAKGRPNFNPLIVHVTDLNAAKKIAVFNQAELQLAKAFWPGPLTLVLPLRSGHNIAPLVSAGLNSVALRVPAHPVARDLLRKYGGPIAAPSANISGQISPTTAAHVIGSLSGKVTAIIDGGPCEVGLESTIIGGAPTALLRPGGLPVESIEKLIGSLTPAGKTITAPGQLTSHYAPWATVRINAVNTSPEEVMLGFGPMESDLNLSIAGNLIEAAANLFGHLHHLDKLRRPIAVAPVPEFGLGHAINDRLKRAAALR